MIRLVALLALLALAACGQPSGGAQACEIDGAHDPCAGDLSDLAGRAQYTVINPELFGATGPWDMRDNIEGGDSDNFDAHLVVRGQYLADTIRCAYHQGYRPKFAPTEYIDIRVLTCYADIQVASYIVGSGPTTLTAQIASGRIPHYDSYLSVHGSEDAGRVSAERSLQDGFPSWHFRHVPPGGVTGIEAIMFIGPALDISIATWAVHKVWDLERQDDGSVIAVHPDRAFWQRKDDYETAHRAAAEMTIPTFVEKAKAAHTGRLADYEGRISEDESSPMLVTSAAELSAFYVEIGATTHPNGPPAQPPPACVKVVPDYTNNPGLVQDCVALLGVKDTLRGTGTLNWSLATAIGSWDGVTVGGTPKRVQSLRLGDKGLTGSIPATLGKLTGLTRLDLSDNQLTGGIPSALGDLSKLEELDLEYNRLNGGIPTSLGSLTGLRKLSLSANQLTGSIPSSLGKLTRLTSLDLAENRLSGTPPSELGNLRALQYLSLGSNGLTGPVPSWVSGLTALQTLYLDNNALTGSIPATLGGLSKLTVLSLSRNQLTGSIPAALGNLSQLEELALSGNRLTGSIPEALTKLKQLEYLYLSGNSLTGCVPAALRKVDNHDLAGLNLPDCA